MNCAEWEERVALYAGGDLAGADAADVERHLAACAACSELVVEVRESLSLWEEDLTEADVAAVRARVLAAIAAPPRPWWRALWIPAVVAATVLLLAVPRGTVPIERLPVVTLAPPPAPALVLPVARKHVRHRVEAHPPMVVKLLTDDPDVVIYWITDSSGE